jgi:hypothetical protein
LDIDDTRRARAGRRWSELVDEVAARRSLLANAFLGEIDGGRRFYESRVGTDELRTTAESAFDLLLRQLAGKTTTAEDIDLPRRIGVRRARQGVESEKLIAAVHRDFTSIWSTLLDVAIEDDAVTLALHAEEVWRVVDNFAAQIHAAYLEEIVSIAQEKTMSRQSFVAQLLSDEHPSPAFITRAQQVLAISEQDGVWVGASAAADDAMLRRFVEDLRRSGRIAYTHHMEGCTVAIWRAASPDVANVRTIDGWEHSVDSDGLRTVRCGIAPLHQGLAQIRNAATIACEISLAMPSTGTSPATVNTTWPLIALMSLGERIPGFRDTVRARLLHCRDSELRPLLQTVRAYAARGDITTTADYLFCHRNTVMKRLRRFRELTGLDMTVPDQAAHAIIALAAVDL